MAQRYCTNCGNELGPDDVFCASCGKPTHQTAAVSTPEADVDVPPPSTQQSGGPGFAPPYQAEEAGKPRISLGMFLFAIIAFVVLLWAIASAGGGGTASNSTGGDPDGAAVEDVDGTDRQPREPEPEPPEPEPIALSGEASQATDFFELEEGLTVIEFSYEGRSNFIADLLDEDGREVGYAIANEIGAGQSSSALRIPRAGRHVLDVDADGPWSATVRQPRPADAPEKTSFSGDGNAATNLFSLSGGLKRVTATYEGRSNFIIFMLDSEGRETAYAMINEIGTGEYSTTVTVPEDGLYLFTVEADGPWTINIE